MLISQALDELRSHFQRLERDLAEADAFIAAHAYKIDAGPRSKWPKGSILELAMRRHELRVIEDRLMMYRADSAPGR